MKKITILCMYSLLVIISVRAQEIGLEQFLEKKDAFINACAHKNSLQTSTDDSRATSDMTIPGPVINFTGNKAFIKSETSIENPTDTSITFTFSDYPVTDSQFMADYILSWVTNPMDTEQSKLQVANAAAHFLKSPKHYLNKALIFGGQWQDSLLFAKEHSLIGRIFSTGVTNCGNNSEHGRIICLKSGYFKPDDFRHIAVTSHAFIETKFSGYFALTDYDQGTCGFMFHNPASPNGLASFMDVHNDTLLINQKYLEDGIDYHPDMSLSYYREVMADNSFNIGQFPWSGHIEIDSKFILSAHSKMTLTIDDYVFFLDSNLLGNKVIFQKMINAVDSFELAISIGDTCWWCVDSFEAGTNQLFDGDTFLAEKILDKGALFFYSGLQDQGKKWSDVFRYEGKREWVPTIVLETSSLDTLILGENLKMPLFLLESDGNILAGDTLITQPAVFPLWSAGNTSNILTYKEVNYLEQGWISPGDHLTKLSWNANILGPFMDWNISGGNGLSLSRSLMEYHRDTTVGFLPVELSKFAATDDRVVAVEYVNLLGQRVDANTIGIKIVRSLHESGSIATKIVVKQ